MSICLQFFFQKSPKYGISLPVIDPNAHFCPGKDEGKGSVLKCTCGDLTFFNNGAHRRSVQCPTSRFLSLDNTILKDFLPKHHIIINITFYFLRQTFNRPFKVKSQYEKRRRITAHLFSKAFQPAFVRNVCAVPFISLRLFNKRKQRKDKVPINMSLNSSTLVQQQSCSYKDFAFLPAIITFIVRVSVCPRNTSCVLYKKAKGPEYVASVNTTKNCLQTGLFSLNFLCIIKRSTLYVALFAENLSSIF